MFVIRGRSTEGKLVQRDENFTGQAWGDHLLSTPNGVGMSTVYFAPGARTYWHRHEEGQILSIVSGEGIVATRDGEVALVRAGDIVWTEPGVEHWHGACFDTFFVHTSASIGATDWRGEVAPADYTRAQQRDQA